MTEIWVVVIASIIAPTVLKALDWVFDKRKQQKVTDEILKRTLRLEILMNLNHNPDDEETILELSDEYTKHGWNSYVHNRVKEWWEARKHDNKK